MLQNRRAAFIQGHENMDALTELSKERNLSVVQLASKAVALLVPDLRDDLPEYYGMENFSFAALIRDPVTGNHLVVMT